MPQPLLEVLKNRVLLCDGAMGTQLQRAGLKSGDCGELWNLDEPEKVMEIQKRYADAGSDMILTNTFGGCRIPLERHKLEDKVEVINEAAAKIVRSALGPDKWVIGDIGPFGGMLDPYGDFGPEDVEFAFLEQARGLLKGGADILIVETQTALEELELGIKAAKQAIEEAGLTGKVPVIGSLAFDKTVSGPPKTMMGVDPERAAKLMVDLGVDIVACNCGTNLVMDHYVEIVEISRQAAPGKPIMAQPNAGKPEMENGVVIYRETPEEMAKNIHRLIEAGANIVGGCCGTTPEHIAAFRKVVDQANA